jgi:poly(beta-D-mannuronate) C5 epimerase
MEKLLLFVLGIIMLIMTSAAFQLLPFLFSIIQQSAEATTTPSAAAPQSSSCIAYDFSDDMIRLTCNSASLTDIYNQLKDTNVIHKENSTANTTNAAANDKTWLLNAGIEVDNGATLYINSTDTKWLKIIGDGENPNVNAIHILGSLNVNSVKITSWNPKTNDYTKYDVWPRPPDDGEKEYGYDAKPRPYIHVEKEAIGSTKITNSEIAYLGYLCSGCYGLTISGGNDNVLNGNDIHQNHRGFYSKGVGSTIIEANHVHNNYQYGIDPHTTTHDMIIKNNTVHDNGATGIICSKDCFKITIEGNEVYNNDNADEGRGIAFSQNMYKSVARNNYVHNQNNCIDVGSDSHDNEIYDNRLSDCKVAPISISDESFNNKIYKNVIDGVAVNCSSSNAAANTNDKDSDNK